MVLKGFQIGIKVTKLVKMAKIWKAFHSNYVDKVLICALKRDLFRDANIKKDGL